MRIRNSSRVGFSLLSPQLLHRPASSFAPDPFLDKPAEEAKQHLIRETSMRRRGGDHLHGPLQGGETDGEEQPQQNRMALTARGFKDRSIFFDADGSKSSLRMNIGPGVSVIIEQELHKNIEQEEERLNITGERGCTRKRETNTKNSGAQISQGDARWMEGEARVIPLMEKRKAISSFGVMDRKETKTNTCAKKRNVPRRKRIPDEEARELSQDNESTNGTSTTGAKKRGIRNSATLIMEGSRCSRINGRGWRCCQQTLVGYSLCEHHLGKGRLRSMNAVHRRPTHLATSTRPDPNDSHVDNFHGDDKSCCTIGYSPYNQPKPEEKETMICSKKKRRKLIGNMVKARSISSLLNELDSPYNTKPNRSPS